MHIDIVEEAMDGQPRNEAVWTRSLPLWLFVGVLFWAPFPLGSNRPWSWSILSVMVAVCWTAWGITNWRKIDEGLTSLRPLLVPCLLAAAVMTWALLQTATWLPHAWSNPVWHEASLALHRQISGSVSVDPWRTLVECEKLTTYAMALLLVYLMARNAQHAKLLLNAIIAIGAFYGFYAAFLKIAGFEQLSLFPSAITWPAPYVIGPFVSHNSYAAFAGLCSLAAIARLVHLGWPHIGDSQDIRTLLVRSMRFLLGPGAPYLLAFLITYSTLIASASRGGLLATSCGALAMLGLGLTVRYRTSPSAPKFAAYVATGGAAILMLALFAWNGNVIVDRSMHLLDSQNADRGRYFLWEPALRMIADRPLLGVGLGTYQDAYPLYATRVIPYVVDKAHNDYAEFAAGLGLPAAAAWWISWCWLVFACVQGALARRRNSYFGVLAVGATVLVAVHSALDFSLQIPAIALLYAALLGIGLSLCRPAEPAT